MFDDNDNGFLALNGYPGWRGLALARTLGGLVFKAAGLE